MPKLGRVVVVFSFSFFGACSRASGPTPMPSTSDTEAGPAKPPTAVAEPEGICRLSASTLADIGPVSFRLQPGGLPFALVGTEGSGGFGVTAGAPKGEPAFQVRLLAEPGSVGIHYESPLLRLHGFAETSEVELFFAKPAPWRGFLIPLRLEVGALGPEGIGASPHLGKSIELTEAASGQPVACTAVSLAKPSDARLAAPPGKKRGDLHALSGRPNRRSCYRGPRQACRASPSEQRRRPG